MNRKEFKDELKMTYGELQSYLVENMVVQSMIILLILNVKVKIKKYLEQEKGYIVIIWMKIREEI